MATPMFDTNWIPSTLLKAILFVEWLYTIQEAMENFVFPDEIITNNGMGNCHFRQLLLLKSPLKKKELMHCSNKKIEFLTNAPFHKLLNIA